MVESGRRTESWTLPIPGVAKLTDATVGLMVDEWTHNFGDESYGVLHKLEPIPRFARRLIPMDPPFPLVPSSRHS